MLAWPFEVQVATIDFFVNAILAACVERGGTFFAEDLLSWLVFMLQPNMLYIGKMCSKW